MCPSLNNASPLTGTFIIEDPILYTFPFARIPIYR